MRVLQTGDWHLGHTLHDVSRVREHARFLTWLVETLVAEQCDALLVCGDVFEMANPPAQAQRAWYDFLAAIHRRLPALRTVVIGGNHDSPARLEAARPLLEPLHVSVIGALPRTQYGALDLDRLLVPLPDSDGQVAAWVAAVPFLRPADLLPAAPWSRGADLADAGADPLIEGVRTVYAEVLAEARRRRQPRQALIAMGHAFLVGGAVSLLSERRILGGNQHALPVDIFPDDVTYVALGHLHKAQRVGGRDHVRYAGSPVPLAMSELDYRHQVCVVDLATDGTSATVRAINVPRTRALRRVPRHGAAPLDEVLSALRGLPDRRIGHDQPDEPVTLDDDPGDDATLLEICVSLPRPEPRLRRRIEEVLAGKGHHLVKLSVATCGDGLALAEATAAASAIASLADLDPVEVFVRRYLRDHTDQPAPALLAAFHEVLESVHQGPR